MFGLSLTKILGIGIFIALIVGFLTVQSCMDRGRKAAQARQDARSADAYSKAAEGAVATVSARSEAEAELKDVVAEAAVDIAKAEGSENAIPPAARAAALRAACRLREYANHPACVRLLEANP